MNRKVFRVRIDYPAINESRYFTWGGQLSSARADAREFKTRGEAVGVARTFGPNAAVEEEEK